MDDGPSFKVEINTWDSELAPLLKLCSRIDFGQDLNAHRQRLCFYTGILSAHIICILPQRLYVDLANNLTFLVD